MKQIDIEQKLNQVAAIVQDLIDKGAGSQIQSQPLECILETIENIEISEEPPQNDAEKVWAAVLDSSDGNGHDFGFVEDVVAAGAKLGLSAQQVGGHITNFSKANKLEVCEPITTDSGTWTQFIIEDDFLP